MTSNQIAWLVVAIVIVLLVVLVVVALSRRSRAKAEARRREALRSEFGAEYDRVVDRTGDARRADQELAERQRRYRTYSIRELSDQQRRAFTDDWQRLQASFVDRPGLALGEADRLVADLLRARGFPMTDAETAAADLSVEHADAVQAFRQGHAIAVSGTSDAEQMRVGMLLFRQVVEQLLSTDGRVVDLRTPPPEPSVPNLGTANPARIQTPGPGAYPAGTDPRGYPAPGYPTAGGTYPGDGADGWQQPPPPSR